MTHKVAPNVAKSSKVCISYSITKLQYSLTAKNNAVSSCDLSDNPTIRRKRLEVIMSKPAEERWKHIETKTLYNFVTQTKTTMHAVVNMYYFDLQH